MNFTEEMELLGFIFTESYIWHNKEYSLNVTVNQFNGDVSCLHNNKLLFTVDTYTHTHDEWYVINKARNEIRKIKIGLLL